MTHTKGGRGFPGAQDPRVGTPGRPLTHPSSSCTTDRAQRSCRCQRRAAGCERHDVIDGQVAGRMPVALVTGAPVSVLAAPCPEHSRTQALPPPRAVQGVVAAAVRLPSVPGAATTRSARDDAADGAELHRRSSAGDNGGASDAGDAGLQGLRHRDERGPGRSCGLFASGAMPAGQPVAGLAIRRGALHRPPAWHEGE